MEYMRRLLLVQQTFRCMFSTESGIRWQCYIKLCAFRCFFLNIFTEFSLLILSCEFFACFIVLLWTFYTSYDPTKLMIVHKSMTLWKQSNNDIIFFFCFSRKLH